MDNFTVSYYSTKWLYTMGDPPKTELYSGGQDPCNVGFPTIGECSGNPSVSARQVAVLWEAAFSFSDFFLKTFKVFAHIMMDDLWAHLPTLCWAIRGFDQNRHDLRAPPFLFSWFCSKWLFLFPQWKKYSRRNVSLIWKRWNKKWQKH